MARKPFSPSEIDTRSIVGNKPYSRFVIILLFIAIILAILFAISGFGSRWGWWHFSTGFSMMRWAAYGGIGLSVLSVIALIRLRWMRNRRGKIIGSAALLISLLLFAIPLSMQQYARNFPPIHDITTDTETPPEFVEIIPLRADAPNPPEYEGDEVAEQQRSAYPEIEPLRTNLTPEQVYDIALEAANNMRGWEIKGQDRSEGRIEATSTTFWYGFKDDVVIRLQSENGQTVIDVRSKSRVGRGDLGVNARRIDRYLSRVSNAM